MTSHLLELTHMDLFDLIKTKSLSGNRFVFVLVDDFSRFNWVFFSEHKDKAFSYFNVFRKSVGKEKNFDFPYLK